MAQLPTNQYWYSCDELPEEEGTPYDVNRNRTYTRRFQVLVFLKNMAPAQVCLCPILPKAGTFYAAGTPDPGDPISLPIEYDRFAMMMRMSAKRMAGWDLGRTSPGDTDATPLRSLYGWIVTVEYGTVFGNISLNPALQVNNQNSPDKDLAEVTWNFEEAQEAPPHDLYGYPYTTSAHMPFSPPPVIPKNYPVLTISRNEINFNYQKASDYATRLSGATFLGAPRGCIQLYAPTAVQKNIGEFYYWRVTYRLKFRPQQRAGGYLIQLRPNGGIRLYDAQTPVPNAIWFKNDTINVLPNLPSNGIGDPDTLYFLNSFADSWQPTYLNKGLYRLGKATVDMDSLVGRPIPIFKNGHPLQHPVILDWQGQEVKPVIGTTEIPPWFIRFEDFGYASIKNLLVKGVS